jgi:hypothetical protein
MTGDSDMMRHWGNHGYVQELSDSERSDYDLLPTILEEDSDELSLDDLTANSCFSKSEKGEETTVLCEDFVFDQEYGDDEEDDDDDDDDSRDDDLSNDARQNSDTTDLPITPLFKIASVSDKNLINNAAQGKYRTVSVFGGIFDMADPGEDADSSGFSSDGFSSDGFSSDGDLSPIAIPKSRSTMKKDTTFPLNKEESTMIHEEIATRKINGRLRTDVGVVKNKIDKNLEENGEEKFSHSETRIQRSESKAASTHNTTKSFSSLDEREKEILLNDFLSSMCFWNS